MKTLKFLPKLIRDKIPELLKKQKKNFIIRKSKNKKEFLFFLKKKFKEEIEELFKAKNKKEFLEELIDIEELILTFLEYLKVPKENFEKMRKEKIKKRGGFKKKIILEKLSQ